MAIDLTELAALQVEVSDLRAQLRVARLQTEHYRRLFVEAYVRSGLLNRVLYVRLLKEYTS